VKENSGVRVKTVEWAKRFIFLFVSYLIYYFKLPTFNSTRAAWEGKAVRRSSFQRIALNHSFTQRISRRQGSFLSCWAMPSRHSDRTDLRNGSAMQTLSFCHPAPDGQLLSEACRSVERHFLHFVGLCCIDICPIEQNDVRIDGRIVHTGVAMDLLL
jgi:hypothetical protein